MTTDVAAITRRLHGVAFALDDGQWGALGALFTPDAVGEFDALGGVREGREAIVGFCRRALGRFAAVQHLITNVEVTVDGDRASSRCSVHAVHVRGGGAPPLHVGGTYLDRWVRTAGEWRIEHRSLRVIWTTGADDA